MLLLAGLGNPGPRYAGNRHNIGFMAVDEIVRRHDFGPWRRRFQADWSEGRVGNDKVYCLKPQTFMNHSGRSLGEAVRFYKLPLESVVVVHDDLDLAPGKLRVKVGGGNGGHNGLRSIDAHIGREYRRVRIGIGHPGDKDLVHDYVLKDFAKSDRAWIEVLLDAIAAELPRFVAGDAPGFMSRIAHLTQPPKEKSGAGPENTSATTAPDKES
jgi:PTH1 family peptidyl-tRNA hydrolase